MTAQIMVVEDEGITAKDIETRLTRMGYRVPAVASTGAEALSRAAELTPDLVLMDIRLKGGMDGIETAGRLRKSFGIPVAYLTAYADEATLSRAQQTGPYGYLVKPFEERELNATIQMALQRRALEQRVEEGKRWLQTILTTIDEAVVATDRDGFVKFMNPVAEALTGWRSLDALGKDLSQVFITGPLPPELGPAEPRMGQPREVLLSAKGGKQIPIELSGKAARNDEGDICGFVWAFRDIASRKRTEENLKDREEHFRSLIDHSTDIVAVVDRDATFYYASPALQRVLGYDPSEMIGRSALELTHEDDVPVTIRALSEPDRAPLVSEIRARHADGTWRTLELSARRAEGGQLVGRFILTARDVTRQRQAEARLRGEMEYTAALGRVGQEMIAALGSRELCDRLCRVATEVLGCEFSHTWMRAEDGDAFLTVAGHGDDAEDWETLRALRIPREIIAGLIDRLESEEIVVIDMDRDNGLLPTALPRKYGIHCALYVALRRQGRIVGVQTAGFRTPGVEFSSSQIRIALGLARTASMALEHTRLVEEIEAVSGLKSDLMDTLSHELRVPLGSVVGIADLFQQGDFGPLTSEQMLRLHGMHRSLRQMHEILEATIELSRIERHRVPLQLEPVSPIALVAAMGIDDMPRYPAVTYIQEVSEDLPTLVTDPAKLTIILKNLLSNAFKFTEAGYVTLRASHVEAGVEIEVSDTGPGIRRDERRYIFQPFQQLKEGRKRDGIGLGLYIARRLTEILGGTLHHDPGHERGAHFRLWIPKHHPSVRPTAA